jgi:hypothetical protein
MEHTLPQRFRRSALAAASEEHHWTWKDQSITASTKFWGDGADFVASCSAACVLAALRCEAFWGTTDIGRKYQVIGDRDWVGFRGVPRAPQIAYTPALYEAFLGKLCANSLFLSQLWWLRRALSLDM